MDVQNSITAVPFNEFETVGRCDLCGGAELDSVDRGLRVARCRQCGHTFFDRRPTQQAIALHYDRGDNYEMWLTQTENRRRANIRRIRLIRRFLTQGPILDVGCGMGEFLDLVGERWPEVGRYGTELSKTALGLAQDKFGLQNLFCGQLQDAPWPSGTFDLVTLWQVLEHVPSPTSVVRKARALLRDGGHLLLAVPNDSESRAFARAVKHAFQRAVRRKAATRYDPLGAYGEVHLNHFSPRTLQYLLAQNGFRVVYRDLDLCRAPTPTHTVFFGLCRLLHILARINLYETLILVGRKEPA